MLNDFSFTTLHCDEKEISYGQNILLEIHKKGELKDFARKHELSYDFIWKITTGISQPSNPLIFDLRNIIHPILWFFTISEEKPFEKKYEDDTLLKFSYQKSIAFSSYLQIKPVTWAKENGFTVTSTQKTYWGHVAPSFDRIKKMRSFFYPADWYFEENNITQTILDYKRIKDKKTSKVIKNINVLHCDEKEISYGQNILLEIHKKGELKDFARKYELSYDFIWKITTGISQPSNPLIFDLRNIIHPILWFFTISEEKPFEKKYEDDTLLKFSYQKSIAFSKLKEITSLPLWAKNNGFSVTLIQKTYNGEVAPSFDRIKKMRNFFYPADWYFEEHNQKIIFKTESVMMNKEEFELINNEIKKEDTTFSRFVLNRVLKSINEDTKSKN